MPFGTRICLKICTEIKLRENRLNDNHTLRQDAQAFLPTFCLLLKQLHPQELTQLRFIFLLQNKVEYYHPSPADIKHTEFSSLFSSTFLHQLTNNNSTTREGLEKITKL
jgi:hypothetical protein